MTTNSPKITLSQRKRLNVLNAARYEFLDCGFRDTSMDQVAKRAEASKRTVYNHFPSKEDLFTAVASQILDEAQQATYVDYCPKRPLDDQLREIAEREIEYSTSEEYVKVFRLFLKEVDNFVDLFDTAVAQAEGGDLPIRSWMQAAMDDGKIKTTDTQLASDLFLSLIKGKLFWPNAASRRTVPSKKEKNTYIKAAVSMFLDHYKV